MKEMSEYEIKVKDFLVGLAYLKYTLKELDKFEVKNSSPICETLIQVVGALANPDRDADLISGLGSQLVDAVEMRHGDENKRPDAVSRFSIFYRTVIERIRPMSTAETTLLSLNTDGLLFDPDEILEAEAAKNSLGR